MTGRDVRSCSEGDAYEAPQAAEAEEVREIPLDRISVAWFCKRTSVREGALEALTSNIGKRGLIHFPMVIRAEDGRYLLIAGSRRLKAIEGLRRETIPCRVMRATEEEGVMLCASENLHQERRNPVEEARTIQAIKRTTGMTDARIGEELGLRQASVSERLSILLLPDDVLANVATLPNSPFKYAHAVRLAPLMRTGRPDRRLEARELCRKTIRCRLTASDVRRHVRMLVGDEYDRLPARLQALFLNSQFMTPDMASLFLNPEKAVMTRGRWAEQLRAAARALTAQEREDFIVRAVSKEWSLRETKRALVKALARRIRPNAAKPSRQVLLGLIRELLKALDEHAMEAVSTSGGERSEALLDEVQRLLERLDSFEQMLKAAPAEDESTPVGPHGLEIIGRRCAEDGPEPERKTG